MGLCTSPGYCSRPNSRAGLTLSPPLGKSQSLKFSWSEDATTRIGSDFTAYGIAWQYTMID